jgi:hypothetical protein
MKLKAIRVVSFNGNPKDGGYITDIWEANVGHTKSGKFDGRMQAMFDFAIKCLKDGDYVTLEGVPEEE